MARTQPTTTHDCPVSDGLRTAIADAGLTAYALGRKSGVAQQVIARFLRGERDLKGDTIDRLCVALRLRLVSTARPAGRPAKAPRTARDEAPASG